MTAFCVCYFLRHKMSPLLYACQGGHLGLAELLVSVNADVNKQDSRGWTVSSEWLALIQRG